jgi:hypothetical protein
MGVRAAPVVSDVGGGTLRAEWGTGGNRAVVSFRQEGKGIVLDYIRVAKGDPHPGAIYFADALRATGIFRPEFIESTAIITPRIERLIRSGGAENFSLAQRMVRVPSLALANEMGAKMNSAELVQNRLGNWVARVELSYGK